MTRVLVTGVSGLLGINLALQIATQHSVYGVYYHTHLWDTPFELIQADLNTPDTVARVFEKTNPEVVVNCAAMANLDQCEEFPVLAQTINAELPGHLARLSHRAGVKFLHISTDAVFDGIGGNYCETDRPNPLSVYAKTKLGGEQQVMRHNPEALIARVNFYGCSLTGTRSLAEWFYNHLSTGERVYGFTNIFFCPLFVDDLVGILWRMIEKELKGLYHVVSSECLSKYQFGVQLAKQFSLDDSLISPSSWQDAVLRAARSPNLCLNAGKIQQDLEEKMPRQTQGLKSFYEHVQQGFPKRLKALTENQINRGNNFH